MKASFLGTVLSVVEREYQRKDGTKGKAWVVVFDSGGQRITDEFYRSEEDFAKMGISQGMVGTLTVDIRNVEKVTKDGKSFTAREWRYVDFKLANNGWGKEWNKKMDDLDHMYDKPADDKPQVEQAQVEQAQVEQPSDKPNNGLPF